MKTVVHVTHEALQKVGGIGAVLEGLCTSQYYLDRVSRNILIGPIFGGDHEAVELLGRFGEVLYSSALQIDRGGYNSIFRSVQDELGVSIIYGRRTFRDSETGNQSHPEVLLFGIGHMHRGPLDVFKLRLYEQFGIQSDIYDAWDYEQYTRIALPARRALEALRVPTDDEPVTIMAHEYMGVPTALLAVLENDRRYRTLFYAHETATVRRIVEHHEGHDTMFYNVLREARKDNKTLEDVFGSQRSYFKHPLVRAARHLDGILAVGDYVRQEMQFVSPELDDADVNLTYNGIPFYPTSVEDKNRSRRLMWKYLKQLIDMQPDYLMTHVTRLAVSKGLWRDLKVLWHLDRQFSKDGRSAVYILLCSELGAPRRPHEIEQMESAYGWPIAHREGYPDLSGGEAALYTQIQRFNAASRAIKIIYVNQFGWSREACGRNMPEEMTFMDLRKAADVEFGQSIYEPFGIAQLEPLTFGAICVPTNVCGCSGFLERVAASPDMPNAIIADYTGLPQDVQTLDDMLHISARQRAQVEEVEASRVAQELLAKLPQNDAHRAELLTSGQELARHMSWNAVAEDYVLPAMARADGKKTVEV